MKTDKELLRAGALIALRQLDYIVSLEFEEGAGRNRLFYRQKEKVHEDLTTGTAILGAQRKEVMPL